MRTRQKGPREMWLNYAQYLFEQAGVKFEEDHYGPEDLSSGKDRVLGFYLRGEGEHAYIHLWRNYLDTAVASFFKSASIDQYALFMDGRITERIHYACKLTDQYIDLDFTPDGKIKPTPNPHIENGEIDFPRRLFPQTKRPQRADDILYRLAEYALVGPTPAEIKKYG